jgi:hypothetical protein
MFTLQSFFGGTEEYREEKMAVNQAEETILGFNNTKNSVVAVSNV